MTADEFRRIALGFCEAEESAHMNHPDFRMGGEIFASLGFPDETWAMVKLTPEQQPSFLHEAPAAFKPCSGVWGRRGATNVHLPSVTTKLAQAALAAAHNNAAAPKAKRKRII